MTSPASRIDAALSGDHVVRMYRQVLLTLRAAGVPHLVGGAHAFTRYSGILRPTKDFDVFLKADDVPNALEVLEAAGFRGELTFPHWLAKVWMEGDFVDLIFSSGNGVAIVDDEWFENAVDDVVLGVPAQIVPVEEIIWSKSFVMERERYDGADVVHLLRTNYASLNWQRLVRRFGDRWRVLLMNLMLFGFVYPAERTRVPKSIIEPLLQRLREELDVPGTDEEICQGTLVSRAQYLVDVKDWGYGDARLAPHGTMTATEIEDWTAAINTKP